VRRLTLAYCLTTAAALAAPAAPVPRGKGGFEGPEWGKPFAPDKKAKFAFDEKAGSVTIEVPAGVHRLSPVAERKGTAPRLFRTARGDFDVQVRVRGEFRVAPVPIDRSRSAR